MSDLNKDDYDDSWEIPIHRSLAQPMYWMGVPRNILISEVILSIMGGVLLKTFSVLLIMLILHFVFRYLGQQDPLFHQVFLQSLSHKPYYKG